MSIYQDMFDSIYGSQVSNTPDYNSLLSEAAQYHGIPGELPVLQQILRKESGGNPNAVSPKGATGLMQLMPNTARAVGVQNINDPKENIYGGVKYYKDMFDQFGGNRELALAAYNAGPGRVKQYGGIPPFPETQKYVSGIIQSLGNDMPQPNNRIMASGDPFQDTIQQIEQNQIAYGSGKNKSVFGKDWTEDCCGGFTTLMVNRKLKSLGVPENELLPTSNLGVGQPQYLAGKFGSELIGKGNFSSELLYSLGEGTVIAGNKPGGGTHAEIVVKDPNNPNNLVVASYGIKGKTLQFKQIDNRYVANLNAGNFTATNPFQKINPDANMMVADVSDQATPTPLISGQYQDMFNQIYGSPKQEAISKMLQPPPGTGGPLTPKTAPDFNTLVNVATVDAPEVKFKFLSKHFFPQLDPNEGAKRFFIKDGITYFIDENDQLQKVSPDTFTGKTKEFFADLLARGPEQLGALIGGRYGGATGAGLGAGAGSIIRQQAAETFLGDKPKGILGQGIEAGKEATAGFAGGMLGKGIEAVGNKALRTATGLGTGKLGKIVANEAPYFSEDDIARIIAEGQRFGIDLTAPEVVNSPTLRALWANLAKMPGEPAERIARFIEQIRNPQVTRAINRELGRISPESSIYQSGLAGKGAAEEIKTGLETSRRNITKPLYEDAFTTGQPVNTQPILEKLDDIGQEFAPGTDTKKLIDRMRTFFVDEEGQPITDLKKLHNSKEQLDKLLSHPETQLSLTKRADRKIMEVKEILQQELSTASPEYAQAQRTFAQESKPLNELLHGNPDILPKDKRKASTIVKRLIDLPEPNAQKAQSIIFDNTSPDQIASTKSWFDASGASDEWNALTRSRLQAKLDKIGNEEGNRGYLFKKSVFGNETERAKLRAALEPDQYQRFSDFMDVLDKTKRIIYTNSETAFQLGTGEAIGENISGWKGLVIKTLEGVGRLTGSITNPQYTAQLLKKQWTPEQADKFLTALMSPEMGQRLSRIKQLGDNTKTLIEIGSVFGSLLAEEKLNEPKEVPLQR